ncbi:hypothetical protein OROMI_016453 [Orobanche minor]
MDSTSVWDKVVLLWGLERPDPVRVCFKAKNKDEDGEEMAAHDNFVNQPMSPGVITTLHESSFNVPKYITRQEVTSEASRKDSLKINNYGG